MKRTSKQQLQEIFATPSSDLKAYEVEKHLRHFCEVTSHELSTLLGAILGELDYANSQSVGGTTSIGIAFKATEKALSLARNLHYFMARTRLETTPSDLSQTILNALDMVEKDFEKRGVHIAAFIESSLYAHVDPSAIQQIILNLLAHAAHSMPNGGKLTLSLAISKSEIEICVSDTGHGYSASELETLFEPDALFKESTFEKFRALELAVVKALIEAHGGEILVRSTQGKGTNCIFRLPYDPTIKRPESFTDKRRYRRIPLTLPVQFYLDDGSIETSKLTTLSVGGCYIHADTKRLKLVKDGELRLRILYYENQALEIPRARIANTRVEGQNGGIGVEFLDISEKASKVLAALVKSHSS